MIYQLAPAAQVALCIMLPLIPIVFFIGFFGGFEKRKIVEENYYEDDYQD